MSVFQNLEPLNFLQVCKMHKNPDLKILQKREAEKK